MNPKIVIIGAGAAGFAAACKLLESGFDNLVVLEAENRIGGRVHTIPFASNVVDMGAQWCHGEKDNVVFQLAQKQNVFDSASTRYDRFTLITSNGEQVADAMAERLMVLVISIVEDYKDELKAYRGSLGDFIVEKYRVLLHTDDYKDIDRTLAFQFLDFFHKYENSIEASDTWFDTSAQGYLHYWDCDGDRLLNWKDRGYGSLFDLLQKKIPDPTKALPMESKIQFGKTVTNIAWARSPEETARITCSDGTCIDANHVILTASLGVLKEKHLSMFTPELPVLKTNAIKGLTLGTVDKIYLEFKEPFWTKDWQGFSMLWNKSDWEEVRAIKDGEWLVDIFGFFAVDYQPNILCGWISGEQARKMEMADMVSVEKGVMYLLRKFLKNYSVPDPVRVERTKWYSNPNFRGSYSYRSIKTDLLNTSAYHLATPLMNMSGVPVLQFAGEASHEHYYSTVHGAVETGWREAKRLIDLYNPPKKEPPHYDIVIVGAGIAGLGAATYLKNKNQSFIVLEAQDRPGGRINTTHLIDSKTKSTRNSGFVEAGAQWLHGKENVVYEIAKINELLSSAKSEEGQGAYIRNDGYRFDEFFVEKVDFEVGKILMKCEEFMRNGGDSYPASVKQFLFESFDKILPKFEGDEDGARQLLDWHNRFQIIDNSCMDLSDVSAKSWGQYSFNGEDCQAHINFKHGFSRLVEVLVQELGGSKRIRYNTEVEEIAWNNPIAARIKCKDGVEFTANHVILTCSLGVLRERMDTLFRPKLPAPYRETIESIGFGTIDKIFLQFKTAWWEDLEMDGIQLVWTDRDYKNAHWTRYLSGFDVLMPGPPNTLLGWVGGHGALEMEKLTNEEIVIDCVNLLSDFLQQSVPHPTKYYCSRWYSNQFIRGSYSYTSTKCDKTIASPKLLSQPICLSSALTTSNDNTKSIPTKPIIFFAGEACHEQFFSTTHGAFMSGMEQAAKIMQWK